jgi:hypothetical protein
LWKNTKEIIGNSIYNDHNEYIDDLCGWNFLGKQKDGSEKMIPFSELSKSGKVVNAYNAFIMAEKISRN